LFVYNLAIVQRLLAETIDNLDILRYNSKPMENIAKQASSLFSKFSNAVATRTDSIFKSAPKEVFTGLLITMLVGLVVAPAVIAAPIALTNPSLEQVANGTANCYEQAGWGDNNANWALTADSHSGNVAQSVTVSNYASGDRKLMMSENANCAPSVTPGASYQLSAWYKSTSAKNGFTVFRHSAAGWTYWTDVATLPATANWTQANGTTPVVPAGTDQITFGISTSANGTLTTDDYYMGQVGTAPAPTQLTSNNSLEDGTTATPDGWMLAGWGDAKVTSGLVTGAHTGTKAYSITLANRTQGDFKLLPSEAASPAVQPGVVYQLSTWYKSTTASNSLTVFAHTSSGWGYWTDIQTLPAVANWTNVTAQTPPIPAGIDAIAWGVSIYGNGTLVTDDYSTMKFADATAPPTTGPAAEGQWTVLDYNLPIRAVHSTVLKNGKVLLIAGSGNDADYFAAGTFKASVWDPVAGTFTTLNVPKDMFCAGHVTLPDGRVLIQGGTKSFPTTAGAADYGGLRDSWIFNPDTNTFTPTNLANEGHWYPTLTELGNGDIWMAGGLKEDTSGAVNTEMFDHTTGQWKPTNQVQQTYSFWGLYPHMFLLQDGRMFYSGAHVFGNGLPGTGASIYDPTKGTIADVTGLRDKDMRDQSASVLLPPAQDQKVLITGGGNINTNNVAVSSTDIIDLKQANPTYTPGPDMPGMGKMYVNATTLPDRTVLTTNGGQLNRDDSTNVLTAADYDPATNKWTSVAADPIGRNYHSSAVLLPDGRVAVFGSNPGDGSYELRISVYNPTYMYKTVRPTINNAPTAATYGSQFTFNVNAPGKTIKWAQLMRPMSVTHQMDSNMRLVDLPVVVQNGVATVSVTANHNLLPPGPYMLTVTDSDGVPSPATWVMIH
jgi:hypothetical protein